MTPPPSERGAESLPAFPARERGAASSSAFPARERGAASSSAFPARERGAALLTVLLLVAVMAVVSATAVERLTLATRLAGSAAAIEQARAFTLAAEALAMRRIEGQLARADGRVTADGGWIGAPFTLPLPGGSATMTVADGGNCFNLNSLVDGGSGAPRAIAIEQFVGLMQALGVERGLADRIAGGSVDWIDPDQTPTSYGAEDAAYAGAPTPYRSADRPMVDAGEIAAIAGATPVEVARLKPWLCALPVEDLSPINVNTLLPEQAPLLMMLVPARLSPAQARTHLAARPAGGYGSVNRFWNAPTLDGVVPAGDAAAQVGLTTRWFRLRSEVRLGDVTIVAESLIDAGEPPARVVRRKWGPDV